MDTISRENNSPLPVAGVIVGVLALIIGGYAAISLSKVNRTLAAQADKVARIDDLASQIASVSAASDKAAANIQSVATQTQTAITTIAGDLGTIHEQLKHMEDMHAAHTPAKGAVKGEPAVAGPGEYIVKSGDSGSKIARANECTLADLEAVNPTVTWTHLKVGEKLKLPEKK
jgi:LysM repeat protein